MTKANTVKKKTVSKMEKKLHKEQNMTVAQLRNQCRAQGLKVGGKKSVLRARLSNPTEEDRAGHRSLKASNTGGRGENGENEKKGLKLLEANYQNPQFREEKLPEIRKALGDNTIQFREPYMTVKGGRKAHYDYLLYLESNNDPNISKRIEDKCSVDKTKSTSKDKRQKKLVKQDNPWTDSCQLGQITPANKDGMRNIWKFLSNIGLFETILDYVKKNVCQSITLDALIKELQTTSTEKAPNVKNITIGKGKKKICFILQQLFYDNSTQIQDMIPDLNSTIAGLWNEKDLWVSRIRPKNVQSDCGCMRWWNKTECPLIKKLIVKKPSDEASDIKIEGELEEDHPWFKNKKLLIKVRFGHSGLYNLRMDIS
jgi:hypothetical protein